MPTNTTPASWAVHDSYLLETPITSAGFLPPRLRVAATPEGLRTASRLYPRLVTTTGSTTSNTFTIPTSTTGTGATAGKILLTFQYGTETATVRYADLLVFANVTLRPFRAPTELPKSNHRGRPLRSAHKGRQFDNAAPEELVALQLLRSMVGSDEFRKYLKHGFVSVRGTSGLVYQIGRSEHVRVWDGDTRIASLCVHLKVPGAPPTDEVVAKLLMAELDEPNLWRRSNKTWHTSHNRPAFNRLGVAA